MSKLGCGIIILIFNLLVGGWSVNFILNYFDKDIPFIADTLIGLFVAQISIPVACVMWILQYFGVI